MFLRLIKLILKQNKQIESIRELLFSHKYFNLVETFRLFDSDEEGAISAKNFEEGFAKFNIQFVLEDLERLVIHVVDDENNGTVDLREFTQAVTPLSAEFKHSGKASSSHLSLEQRKVSE